MRDVLTIESIPSVITQITSGLDSPVDCPTSVLEIGVDGMVTNDPRTKQDSQEEAASREHMRDRDTDDTRILGSPTLLSTSSRISVG